MSKAFTKESDVEHNLEKELLDEYFPPPGGKNYLTPAGFKTLHAELHRLEHEERPRLLLASSPEMLLREVERRIRYLTRCLQIAEVLSPPAHDMSEVRFGAHVTVRDERDEVKTYYIVGVDEAQISEGKISWLSPLATALTGGTVGDTVSLATPLGERELEIIAIRYSTPD